MSSIPTAPPINDVLLLVEKYFPGHSKEVEACLSTVATLFIEDIVNPTALILVGPPSSLKTTLLGFFKDTKQLVYSTDRFSPKSFVSCYANGKAVDLEKIDLLPKIKHKTLIVPELAPLFRGKQDELVATFSTLTRVLDGEGFWVDSGTTGGRGYQGDYMFCWLGGTTPFDYSVWKIMSAIGSRMFFLTMREDDKSLETLAENNGIVKPFRTKCVECRETVNAFLQALLAKGGPRSVKWDHAKDDPRALKRIAAAAKLVARLRGTIRQWTELGSGDLEHSRPTIEQPDRANTVLYNFARGRAICYGRNYIGDDDAALSFEIALSSGPEDRRILLDTLRQTGGEGCTSSLSKAMNCSEKVTRGLMIQFIALGLADDVTKERKTSEIRGGYDERTIRLKEEIRALLGHVPSKEGDISAPEGISSSFRGTCEGLTTMTNHV